MSEKVDKTDWLTWMCTRLMIGDKSAKTVSFVPNRIQCKVLGTIMQQWKAGLPARVIVLKPRQVGISTAIQALQYTICFNRPHVIALVAAHDDKASAKVFRKARFFHRWVPQNEQKPTVHDNAQAIQWAEPHGSRFEVETATNNLGRAGTFQLFHASELAFWQNDKDAFQSAIDTMPKNAAGSLVAIESTANGDSGEYHVRWRHAAERLLKHPDDLNGFIPLFFSWLDHDEYALPVPSYGLGTLDEEEQWLVDVQGARPEQLAFRRYVLQEEYANNLDKFHENYPSTAEEAFLSTGSAVIPGWIREAHKRLLRKPMYAKLEWSAGRGSEVIMRECLPDPQGCWQIWEKPKEGYDYSIGADVSEGIPCDINNPRSETDRSAASIINRHTYEQAAVYLGRIEPDAFGEELLKAGYFFNSAYITSEVNAPGILTLHVIRSNGYPHIYQRLENLDSRDHREPHKLGWKTTTGNRDYMIDQYLDFCRPNDHGNFDDKFQCRSQDLLDEETTFIRKAKTGKREHRAGAHDDLIFATALAWQGHQRCPRRNLVATKRRTHEDLVRVVNQANAIDPGLDFTSSDKLLRTA